MGPIAFVGKKDIRGRKGTTDEGGVRVPFILRWPNGGVKPGTHIDNIAGAIDLLPTLADFTDTTPLGDKPIDGQSLAGVLRGKNET